MTSVEQIRAAGYRVAVLCGGRSSEREVSLISGRAVETALRAAGCPCDCYELEENRLPAELDARRHLILPVIHGSYGEDGRLSADLERGAFAYGGSDAAASVLCFDKLATKALAVRSGLPVAIDLLIRPNCIPSYADLVQVVGSPFILKPRRDGSSIGLHLVSDEPAYERARADLACGDYLAEAFLEGHDLTVGFLRGKALGVVAVHPEGGLYDYDHKYTSGLSRYEVPARIPSSLAEQLQSWTLEVLAVCGGRDLARVDFRLGRDGSVVFLEINTLPGMTPTSLLPKTASLVGLDFAQLVLQWVACALERAVERRPA